MYIPVLPYSTRMGKVWRRNESTLEWELWSVGAYEATDGLRTRTLSPQGPKFVRGVETRRPYISYARGTWLHDPGSLSVKPSTGRAMRYENGTRVARIRSTDLSDFTNPSGIAKSRADELIARTNNSVRNNLSNMEGNYGESLAEARSGLKHLADTAGVLASSVLAASKGNWAGVARHLGVSRRSMKSGAPISARWLEYQYAWLPLMGEVTALHSDLQTKLVTKDLTIQSKSMAQTDWIESVNPITGSWRPVTKSSQDFQCSVGVHVEIVAKVSQQWAARMASLGLINPWAVLWYRLPFSFVFDWFVPVSSFLEAVSATAGLSFVTGSRTVRYSSQSSDCLLWRYSNETVLDSRPPVGGGGAVRVNRGLLTSFPLASLYRIRDPLGTRKSANAIALVHQVALSKR